MYFPEDIETGFIFFQDGRRKLKKENLATI
jgi:hypothetical protein